jgi:hypothetical protein
MTTAKFNTWFCVSVYFKKYFKFIVDWFDEAGYVRRYFSFVGGVNYSLLTAYVSMGFYKRGGVKVRKNTCLDNLLFLMAMFVFNKNM